MMPVLALPWQVQAWNNKTTVHNRLQSNEETRERKIAATRRARIINPSRRGTLSNIDGTTLILTATDGKTYTVNINSNTVLRRRFGGLSNLGEFSNGDQLLVMGPVDTTNKTITARTIWDNSIQKFNGTFLGTVTPIDNTSFTLSSAKRGEQKVVFETNIKFVNSQGKMMAATDIKANDKVRVSGLWDSKHKQITEVKTVRDLSS